jgi:hypothetical protein
MHLGNAIEVELFMRRGGKIVLISICFAIVIAALSGFVDITPQGIVGATWHGWPFAWRYVIVYPGSPENYDFKNFLFDFIVWFIPILAIMGLLSMVPRGTRK